MVQISDEVVAEMVEAIVGQVDPETIYLFGSRARGEGGADSDLDLLIIEREPFSPERSRFDEIDRIYQVLRSFRVPTDVLVYSRDEVRKWGDTTNHVVARAMREGRVLYERS